MLRDFQAEIKARVYALWQNPHVIDNTMVVSPTGSGKTVIFGDILRELMWPSAVIAHRQELLGQIALALNREKVPHGIVAPTAVIRQVVQLEMDTHGESHFNARSPIRVVGVNTLERRGTKNVMPELQQWLTQARIVIIDEGHHVLSGNVWGKALKLFPNARSLLFTAHAVRADGAGLGRGADGVVDNLIIGPSARKLINRGFLTDYRIICPPSDVDVSAVPIGATGDYSAPKLRAAIHKSKTIVGDIAAHYLKFAAGKLGITFTVDIEAAAEVAQAYRHVGVPAEVITYETPTHIRAQIMRKFRRREILQLVNVDMLGEGVDVPAIEVVSMARHTASFQLFSQQFGRGIRLMITDAQNAAWDTYTDAQRLDLIARSVKPKAIIIDHVGNVLRHGLPDVPREYTLTRRERGTRKGPSDPIPLRTCLNTECLHPYQRIFSVCPRCGTPAPAPANRSTAEMVEGDLIEMDAYALAELRGEVERINDPVVIPSHLSGIATLAVKKNHAERQRVQGVLRSAVALWAGYFKHRGAGDSEIYRRFWYQFGFDIVTAQALGAAQAQELHARIVAHLQSLNIVEAT